MARKVALRQISAPKTFSLISEAKLKQLYAAMLKCRLLDELLRDLPSSNTPKHSSSMIGQEAAIVGAAIDLRRDDWILPQRSTAAAALLRGEPLRAIASVVQTSLAEPSQSGKETPHAILPFGNTVPPVATLSAQLNIGIGLALAAQAREKGQLVMAFCEAEAAASPQIAESLRFSVSRRLPLLILALHSKARSNKSPASSKKTGAATLVSQSRATGIPVIPVDQADIVAMYRVAFESIHKARRDGGPTLIETAFWPLPAKNLVSNDPIDKMEEYLRGKGLFSDRWKQSLVSGFKAEAAQLERSLS